MESLNSHMHLTAQYVYMNNSGAYLGSGINSGVTNLEVHGVRVSLSWSPQAR